MSHDRDNGRNWPLFLVQVLAGTDERSTQFLGFYLLLVALCQFASGLWSHIHKAGIPGWFRFGFSAIAGWTLNEEFTPYYLAVLWLSTIAILMIRGKQPFKTYVTGELFLSAPSIFVIAATHGPWQMIAAFLFESVVPLIWCVMLLWRKHEARRPIPLPGARAFGLYLLFLNLYGLAYAGVLYFCGRMFKSFRPPDWLSAIRPRLTVQFLASFVVSEFEIPDSAYLILCLFGLTIAVALIRGRQPLKTYMVSELLLVLPGAAIAAMFLTAPRFPVTYGITVLAIFLWESAIPLGWSIRLLWQRRKIARMSAAASGV